VVNRRIDLTIGGELKTYQKRDIYHIPAGVKHAGRIYAGYTDVTFFDEPNRYEQK
jgi:quercetin dioxygenase-like cupin family protein